MFLAHLIPGHHLSPEPWFSCNGRTCSHKPTVAELTLVHVCGLDPVHHQARIFGDVLKNLFKIIIIIIKNRFERRVVQCMCEEGGGRMLRAKEM